MFCCSCGSSECGVVNGSSAVRELVMLQGDCSFVMSSSSNEKKGELRKSDDKFFHCQAG